MNEQEKIVEENIQPAPAASEVSLVENNMETRQPFSKVFKPNILIFFVYFIVLMMLGQEMAIFYLLFFYLAHAAILLVFFIVSLFVSKTKGYSTNLLLMAILLPLIGFSSCIAMLKVSGGSVFGI